MTEPRLVDLVYAREFDRALEAAADLTPEAIRRRLLRDDKRWLQDEEPCDEFLRRWYAALDNPYLRADAADCFVSAFTTELAPVPNAEYIGANWRTESLRSLIAEVSDTLLGEKLRDLEETPEHPLPAEYAEKWRAAGKILAELDLPPAVPLINPDPPEHHRTTAAAD